MVFLNRAPFGDIGSFKFCFSAQIKRTPGAPLRRGRKEGRKEGKGREGKEGKEGMEGKEGKEGKGTGCQS